MTETNPNGRLEAFCDGVFAIAMTLLVLDIHIPSSTVINSNADFWQALGRLAPSISTFVLSFAVILITWVNHHASLKLVNGSCPSFLYANGLLLLTIVFLPFPTALMGETLLTDHAAPAVVLYNAVVALQSIGWSLIFRVALKNHLAKNEKAKQVLRANMKSGYYSAAGSVVLMVLAFWFPLVIAIIIAMIWIFWLIYGINIKAEA